MLDDHYNNPPDPADAATFFAVAPQAESNIHPIRKAV